MGITLFDELTYGEKDMVSNKKICSKFLLDSEKEYCKFYRTKTGKCYHKEGCACLKNSKISVTIKEIKKLDLRYCCKCCK